MKNSNDIGNRTRDLPACSAVPQPTAPPCALIYMYVYIYIYNYKYMCNYVYIYKITDTHTHTHRVTLFQGRIMQPESK